MISAWWIPVYGLYHLALSGVLMGWISRRQITEALYPGPGETWLGNSCRMMEAAALSTFNVLVSGYVMYCFSEYQQGNPSPSPESLGRVLKQLAWCALWAEIWFYTTHRCLHRPWLYRHIHAWHHRWRRPLPWVTYDAHPLEHVVVNAGTLGVPLFLVGPTSEGFMHLWVFLVLTQATLAHAGPWPYSHHDQHHHQPNIHYGLSLFMDRWWHTQN